MDLSTAELSVGDLSTTDLIHGDNDTLDNAVDVSFDDGDFEGSVSQSHLNVDLELKQLDAPKQPIKTMPVTSTPVPVVSLSTGMQSGLRH